MNKKRIAAVSVTMLAMLSALTGTYAYFTDKKSLDISARTSNLDIEIDDSNFSDENVADMLPGDRREISYIVSNLGDADALVFSEITLISSVPMDDTVEWFIQDTHGTLMDEDRQVGSEMEGGEYVDDVTIEELMESNIKFVSLTENRTKAKFIVNNGLLRTGESSPVDLYLTLGLNAGNSFMNSRCEVKADVYGIQYRNTDEDLTWEFIKDTACANSEPESP
ncbi:TasA family protein [Oribacterium sp. P6A1]|uniref:TasA family protein n=1 Tax=Oribacterium sp. P6A1 TaxID=1410612 RepID=UPI000566905C|nr:TasA family protein [Oribacterium sp. P6A1]